MEKVKAILLLGFLIMGVMGLVFSQQAESAEVVRGRVTEVKEDSNLVGVVYKDPGNGTVKELDLALLPESASAKEETSKTKLHAGDEVSIRLKKNGMTGMYEASAVKLGVS